MENIPVSSIFNLLDGPLHVSSEEEWGDYTDSQALISEANRTFSLVDYLDSRFSMQPLVSSGGWTRRMPCPFHKHGQERTPSFFVNSRKNRFYCQACGITGGLVQFIHYQTNRPEERIAEHIIKIAKDGGAVLVSLDHERKAEEKKKISRILFQMSDMFREFIKVHIDDDLALKYVDNLMSGFDNIHNIDLEETEDHIEEIYKNFETYLATYDRKST